MASRVRTESHGEVDSSPCYEVVGAYGRRVLAWVGLVTIECTRGVCRVENYQLMKKA
jgi:hypothetical protein